MASERFRRSSRLLKSSEFQLCHSKGKRYHGGPFLFVQRKRNGGVKRLGLVVSKKVGGAVIRNRWRRMIRDCFRTHRELVTAGTDNVVIVRRGVKGKPKATTREDLIALLERVGRQK